MRDDYTSRIVPLDELRDFEVADGDPDVRGWEVAGADGERLGEVDQLLVDTDALKVRYLDVDLGPALLDPADERHVLVPIGYARVNEDAHQVVVATLSRGDLARLPAYTYQPLTRDYETSLLRLFDADLADDRYSHEMFDENRFYGRTPTEGEARVTLSEEHLAVGKRERDAGAVRVEKEVETRHVRESVPLVREEVIVERRPARPGMAAEARIGEEEIRVPVHEEELVVQKRTVPREEVVVRKREVAETETVEADLRRERVDIEPEGDVRLRREDR